MSRARSSLQIKLLPTALVAALVMLGSTTFVNAQSYDQGYPSGQSAPQYETAQTDPSGRVARLAYLSGDVEFAPAGENDFGSADLNRPLTTGDRLLTGDDGRAALELGGAALRIDHGSAFNFLELNDNTTQVELSQGTLNLRVRDVGQNQTYEIDTPAVAFVASRPGMYRVDVAPDGNGAMVTVFDGAGTVYGENGASRSLDAGQSYRFEDPSLSNVEVAGVPSPDDFDRWAQSRDDRVRNSVSSRYVSPEVVGYDDLDDYGAWNETPDYGNVWFPTQVSAGWAPYRDGHWAWIEPWGWTWVDDAPWGYAPFHYGRWVYVRSRWGWCPGPRQYRPVYAPALVAFVGGSGFSVSISLGGGGGPVGWFPLGPRDVYVPPYRASRNYFTNVNVTNIRNVYVNKTVINNYYGSYAAQRPMNEARYAYRNDPRALTAVPRSVFTGAKPVRNAVLHVPPRSLAQAQVMSRPHISPTQASLAIRQPKRPIATPARAFDRKVVAKHAPPPRPVPFAARERVIAKQGGAPIPEAQLQRMRQQNAGSKQPPQRVQVIAAQPKASKPLPPMKRVQNFSPNPGNTPVAQTPGRAPVRTQERNTGRNPLEQPRIAPTRAQNPANGATPTQRSAPLRTGELPSARFAHPERNAPSAADRNATGQAQQQRAAQDRQAQQHANQQAQQGAQSEREQSRQSAQQAQAQDRADRARAQQQDQQREAQARQQDQQMRAQQAQEQQRSRQEQQRAAQAHQQQQDAQQREVQARQQQQEAQQREAQARQQQQEAQQREAQARQRDQQIRAQQAQEQQRAAQARQQQHEAQQREAQARQQQQEAQQRAEQARAQQQQHAPPPHQQNQPPPKKKDHDDQDNGH